MLEEWTVEGKHKDILQSLSPKQAFHIYSPLRKGRAHNIEVRAFANGNKRVSVVSNTLGADPQTVPISSILMSKADLVQKVISSATRAAE